MIGFARFKEFEKVRDALNSSGRKFHLNAFFSCVLSCVWSDFASIGGNWFKYTAFGLDFAVILVKFELARGSLRGILGIQFMLPVGLRCFSFQLGLSVPRHFQIVLVRCSADFGWVLPAKVCIWSVSVLFFVFGHFQLLGCSTLLLFLDRLFADFGVV